MNIGAPPVADPYVPPMTMEDSQKYLDGDMFDHDPANLTFQWTTC